ncbi:mediator-associated protein 1 [Melia azedarach]|uniref:Mediator-associated protein 1 n=1 Tax=Melia azedarach TaxID=155640 RepID=A0ACC1Y8I9_MELAZ|nr:mediator-associated protein 1 [Melia azedarach]
MESEKSKRPRLEEQSCEYLVVEDSYDNGKDDEDYVPELQRKATGEKQPSALKRTWNAEEEIAILNGVIRFSTEKQLNPFTERTEFMAFLKESFDANITKTQLFSKLKNMKKKFMRNLINGKAISEPHQNKVFELSSKIWGAAATATAASATAAEPDSSLLCGIRGMHLNLDEMFSGFSENIMEEVLAKAGEAERDEFKKLWKEIQVLELELTMKRARLVEFEAKIILDAFNLSKNAVTL